MKDFKGTEIEGLVEVSGERITQVKIALGVNDLAQRLVLKFENGASLVVDGRFPANSTLETNSDVISKLEGEIFQGLDCLKMEKKTGGSAEIFEFSLLMKFVCKDREVEVVWKAVQHLNFDVDAEPAISFMPPQFQYRPV